MLPFSSIVIPTYDNSKQLITTLGSVAKQIYPHFEVIVIDDGSKDDTIMRSKEFVATASIPIRIFSKPNGGAASARNMGWRHAQGEIVVYIDTGCTVEPCWLMELISEIGETDAVGGNLVSVPEDTFVERYVKASKLYRHRTTNRGNVRYLVSGNLAIKKNVLEVLGGFHESPGAGGEDVDLSYQMLHHNFKITIYKASTPRGGGIEFTP